MVISTSLRTIPPREKEKQALTTYLTMPPALMDLFIKLMMWTSVVVLFLTETPSASADNNTYVSEYILLS